MEESVIAAFGEEHTSQLTGVTIGQLRFWDRTNFYHPSYAAEDRRMAFSRVYSFRDIVALRVLGVLRNQYGVSLQHLRDVSKKLSHLADRWTGTRLYVLRKRVVWYEPGTEKPVEITSGQYVIPTVLMDTVLAETKRDLATLNQRDESKHGVIERSRYINHNAPVIAGTRIPVRAVKAFADAGYTTAQIREEYPDLTDKDVEAALAYEESRVAA